MSSKKYLEIILSKLEKTCSSSYNDREPLDGAKLETESPDLDGLNWFDKLVGAKDLEEERVAFCDSADDVSVLTFRSEDYEGGVDISNEDSVANDASIKTPYVLTRQPVGGNLLVSNKNSVGNSYVESCLSINNTKQHANAKHRGFINRIKQSFTRLR